MATVVVARQDLDSFSLRRVLLLTLPRQTYIVPTATVFEAKSIEEEGTAALNNMRVYGTCCLLLMALIVFVGVKYVSTVTQKYPATRTYST